MGKTPTSRFSLGTGLSYPVYIGPGAGDQTVELFPSIQGSFSKETKLNTYTITASYAAANTTDTELEDTGPIDVEAIQHSYSISGSVAHKVNDRNSLSFSAGYSGTNFTGDDSTEFVPSDAFSVDGTWSHTLSK
jgi:hypothetical protein